MQANILRADLSPSCPTTTTPSHHTLSPSQPRTPRTQAAQGSGNSSMVAKATVLDAPERAAQQQAPGKGGSGNNASGGESSSYASEAARAAAFSEAITPEEKEAVPLGVTGELPAWLRGQFLRNGPGHFKGMTHLFDGHSILVGIAFDGAGRASLRQRFVESMAWQAFRDTGKMRFAEYGTRVSPLRTLWNTALGLTGLGPGFTDNPSVNVLPVPGGTEVLAVTESVAGTYRVAQGSLATLGQLRFRDSVPGQLTTAHPSLLDDGTLINLTSGAPEKRVLDESCKNEDRFGSHYTVVRSPPGSDVRQEVAKVPLRTPPTPSWIHDFPVTQRHAIVPETPVIFNLKAALFGGADHIMFDWKPAQGSRLTVVPLDGSGPQRTLDAPPYFTFHYLNSYEAPDGKAIIVDFPRFEDASFLDGLLLENLRTNGRPIARSPLVRMTVPLEGSAEVKIEPLLKNDEDCPFCELPRVNPKHKGKPYRYAYSVSAVLPCSFGNALAKIDVEAGTAKRWHEPGSIPLEPIMVPKPGSEVEDEGAVLSLVNGADGKSFLLVLDAGSFEEVARVGPLPHPIPYGFHGAFIPQGA